MNYTNLVICFISSFFQSLAVTTILLKQHAKFPIKKRISIFIPLWIFCICSFYFITNQLRLPLFITVISLIIYYILEIRDRTVIIYAFSTELFMAILEIIISLILVIIGINSVDIVNDEYYNLLINIFISLTAIFLINIRFIKKHINLFNSIFLKNPKLIKYLYISLLLIYVIVSKNGLEFILKSNYYINILFIVIIMLIFLKIIKYEINYDRLNEQNRQMINYVTKYEKIIAEQSKTSHEFKNQLMVIKGYAKMKSSKLLEYLDSITDDIKKTSSNYLITQLNKFPDGGIKGLLYYKLSVMDDEKIKYSFNVERGVKSKLSSLDIVFYKNITKILGVLLDNAIDACKKIKTKEIIINVSKTTDGVKFSIYNTYSGKLDMRKIGTGYTTKGKGHGYGLKLVNDIIKTNKKFCIFNSADETYYMSEFKIKI